MYFIFTALLSFQMLDYYETFQEEIYNKTSWNF